MKDTNIIIRPPCTTCLQLTLCVCVPITVPVTSLNGNPSKDNNQPPATRANRANLYKAQRPLVQAQYAGGARARESKKRRMVVSERSTPRRLLLGVVVVLLCWCCHGVSCFTLDTVDGRLVVPDIAKVDNAVLKAAEADKFLSLWFIHVLQEPVHTSSTYSNVPSFSIHYPTSSKKNLVYQDPNVYMLLLYKT